MATYTGYTHEFISWPSDDDWQKLWDENPHVWKYKAFPFFKFAEITDPGVATHILPNGINNQDDALAFMKFYLETLKNSVPTIFHMIRDGEDAIGMRFFCKTPKFETNPVFIDILGEDYQDDTAQLFVLMYSKDEDGSREWANELAGLDISSELLTHTGCNRFYLGMENQINKQYWLQLSAQRNLPWAGTYVDDDSTIMYPLSTFGWPSDFVPNVGPPTE